MSTNMVFLTGNLGADVDVRTSGDTTYARFGIATTYRVRVRGGDHYEDRTNWTQVTAFGNLAKTLRRLGKGSRVLVQGHLRENNYEKDGVAIRTTEVIADRVEFQLVKPPEGGEDDEPELPDDAPDLDDEDIPF